MKETVIDRRYAYRGNVLSVRVDKIQLPDVAREEREIVKRQNGVRVLTVVGEKSVLLLQYSN